MNLAGVLDRIVFGNLIYKLSNTQYLLLNLVSFRRQIITKEILLTIKTVNGNKNMESN